MSRQRLRLDILANNRLARGLRSATVSLRNFATSAIRTARRIATGFLAIGAAITGFVTIALREFSKQERAERKMENAFRSYGEEVEDNTQRMIDFANAVQEETAASNDQVLAIAARLKMLGVQTAALQDSTRAVLALQSAGMGEAQALRAIAAARVGDFQMLRRYIPALRSATDEAEQAKIVNDFLGRGYKEQQAMLNTVSGAWSQFRNRISDTLKEVGRFISEMGFVQRSLQIVGDAVKRFGERIREYIESDRFAQMRREVEAIIKALSEGGPDRTEMVKRIIDVLRAGFVVAAERAVDVLRDAMPTLGWLLGSAARAAIDAVKPRLDLPGYKQFDKAAEQLGMEPELVRSGWFGETRKWTKEQREQIKNQIRQNRFAEQMEKLVLGRDEAAEDETAADIALRQAIAAMRAEARQHFIPVAPKPKEEDEHVFDVAKAADDAVDAARELGDVPLSRYMDDMLDHARALGVEAREVHGKKTLEDVDRTLEEIRDILDENLKDSLTQE